MNSYRTAAGFGESVVVEKKSRFVGRCAPVSAREEALDFLSEVKAENRGANHNVFAYYLRDGNIAHSTDDGEPAGTAGVPVLDVLQKAKIADAAIVVTRYFGGILLGAGGLVRAYSSAASAAVDNAGIAVMTPCLAFELAVEYAIYEPFLKLLAVFGAKVEKSDFTADVAVRFSVREENRAELAAALRELVRKEVKPKLIGEFFAPF